MYASYFILFARFFYKTYLSNNARKGKKSRSAVQDQKLLEEKQKMH